MQKDNVIGCTNLPYRKNIRLKEYNYAQVGLYSITVCTNKRLHLFGKISTNGNSFSQMMLNSAGQMIQDVLKELPTYYRDITIDTFQIMPDHVHSIIGINCCQGSLRQHSLPDIVHGFKAFTTKKYIDGVRQNKLEPFDGKLWQRNYYEHVIRDEQDYQNISQYILNNPVRWQENANYKK
jgi:REP element-mobilizing transposase RayT